MGCFMAIKHPILCVHNFSGQAFNHPAHKGFAIIVLGMAPLVIDQLTDKIEGYTLILTAHSGLMQSLQA